MRLQFLNVLIHLTILATPVAYLAPVAIAKFFRPSPLQEPIELDSDCSETILAKDSLTLEPILKCEWLQPGIQTSAIPVFADFDGDSETEIAITLANGSVSLAIINPHLCEIEYVIETGIALPEGNGGPTIGDVDQNGYPDIFLSVGTMLQRWEYNPQSQEMEKKWDTSSNTVTAQDQRLDIIDLNQDGIPEIIPNRGKMVNSLTGEVYPGELPILNATGNGAFAFTADAIPTPAPNGQSDVELVYGSHIYRYDFVANQWILVRKHASLTWGFVANVSLGDMDLDGDVDAVLTRWSVTGQTAIWDLQTDALLGGGQFNSLPGQFASRATIANFDEDPYPEMALSTSGAIMVLDDIAAPKQLGEILWQESTLNRTGNITMTAFDFDNNGTAELLYRDETSLRIFGNQPTPIANTPCMASNGSSYPTIGDIDNDGQAEIIVTCKEAMQIYEAGGHPWGSAPKIWHTSAYSITGIDPQGRIPTNMRENYKEYNNFLTQVNLNQDRSRITLPLADANIEIVTVNTDCSNSIRLGLQICNLGQADLPIGTPITIYTGSSEITAQKVQSLTLARTLGPGQCQQIEPQPIALNTNKLNILALVNTKDQVQLPIPVGLDSFLGHTENFQLKECQYTNNFLEYHFEKPELSAPTEARICQGESYFLNDRAYTLPGIYNQVLKNRFGCDSIITLDLKVAKRPEGIIFASICEGEEYLFRGHRLDQQGIFRDTIPSSSAICDSIVTLVLEVVKPSESYNTVSLCEGDSYFFNGKNFTNAGWYTELIKTQNGCDSLVHFELEFRLPNETQIVRTICSGESFLTSKEAYNETGFYRELYKDVDGCDSLVDITLIVYKSETEYLSASICEDETYLFNDKIISEPGLYFDTLSTVRGCDSVVVLELSILEEPITRVTALVCSGTEFDYNGILYPDKGEYSHTFAAANGCDSIVDLQIIHAPSNITEVTYEICQGEVFLIGDQYYTKPGVYSGLLSSADGCDSLTRYTLTINPTYKQTAQAEICQGESYLFQGSHYEETGIYVKNIPTESGCDSLFILDLTVHPISIVQVDSTICEGESILYNGRQISDAGEYLELKTNHLGCDSLTILNLEIDPIDEIFADGGVICHGDSLHLMIEGESSSYKWIPSIGLSCSDCPDPMASPDVTTVYTVVGASCGGRPIQTQLVVEVLDGPEVALGKDQNIAIGDQVTLRPENLYNPSFQDILWQSEGDTICRNCMEIVVSPTKTTTYEISVSDRDGCRQRDEITLIVRNNCIAEDFLIPNFFSPNGDGQNDKFYIQPYIDAEMKWLHIYDRWGEQVFTADDFETHWDGTYRDQTRVSPGVYAFHLKIVCPDGTTFNHLGNITIIK